ncbi:MAG TPA: hypothetical protein V6D10_22615 [Trichocoleus sp.]
MTSLRETWQEQRRQRQQEMVQRQQQVREKLDTFQQKRQMQTEQLRDELRMFQQKLQQDTQEFLAEASNERLANAEQLTQRLRAFTQTMREQAAQFLSMTAADRSIMAQQLFQDLSDFHTNLSTTVASMRQNIFARMAQIQAEVEAIQLNTQMLLKANQQERLQNQMQTMQELAEFVEAMQNEVKTYLSELELMRHDRANHLHRMLHQDYEKRMTEMNALFTQLGQFRAELVAFCADLHQRVWGELPAPIPTTQVKQPETPLLKPKPITAAPAKTATAPGKAVMPVSLEQKIYGYVHQKHGASLTDLETALSINRFEAVDALRSLIKQGRITQRDHTYLIQEEA